MRALVYAAARLVSLMVLLSACASEVGDVGGTRPESTLAALQKSSTLTSANPRSVGDPPPPKAANRAPEPPKFQVVKGTGKLVGTLKASQKAGKAAPEDAVQLSFVNADIKDVARAVLGELLGVSYEIGSSAQGKLTIETKSPIARSEVLGVFEQVLALNNLALVESSGLYKIVRAEEAQKVARIISADGPAKPGYGTEILPLKFVSASAIQKVITPLVPTSATVSVDAERNLLFIKGSGPERRAVLEAVDLFDVNWLRGMSFALYSPDYASASALIEDLEPIVGGEASPIGGLVRFVEIDRLNAILMISPQASYLADVKAWMDRLDRPGRGSGRQLYVYRVQNGRAGDLASVLSSALGSQIASPGGAQHRDTGPRGPAPAQSPPVSAGEGEGIGLDALSGFSVSADETNNAIIIVATPQEYEVIRAALQQLDVEPQQVLLEAAIAEVTLTDDLRYGVQFFFEQSNKLDVVLSKTNSANIAPTFPGLAYLFNNGNDIEVVLDALASVTRVEVLSSPKLLVLNNQSATLQVGNQVPIVTQQSVSTTDSDAPIVNSVQYQDTGVILEVTPRVNEGGLVMLDITQEVSTVVQTVTSGIDSPTFQQRKIESTVAVQDNQTVVLAGLIQSENSDGRSGIPVLQSIPAAGALFRSTDTSTTKTELLVLLTPRVISTMERARSVTSELKAKLSEVEPLLNSDTTLKP